MKKNKYNAKGILNDKRESLLNKIINFPSTIFDFLKSQKIAALYMLATYVAVAAFIFVNSLNLPASKPEYIEISHAMLTNPLVIFVCMVIGLAIKKAVYMKEEE